MKPAGHVLVVDDNATNRALLEANLANAGYAVESVDSGAAALASFAARPPDLILLDVMMPGIDGFETCLRLRKLPGGGDVAIVFVTALNDLGSHQRALESGADDFLVKPINRTELLMRVSSLLRITRLKKDLNDGYALIRTQRDALLVSQRQRESLTSLVVHDLKNPLTAILFNAEWLWENCALGEDKECARQIAAAGQSMNRLVMNLLDISRSEEGALVPQLAEVDLAALVTEAIALTSKDVRERIQPELAALTIEADPDLVRRIVENLLDNARKYSPKGSPIRVEVMPYESEWAEIRVHDRGAGIPAAQRERIFEKYARLEGNSGDQLQGSRGLGLTFCRLAADVHNGKIWVEDGPVGGSVFRVRLPLVQRPTLATTNGS